MPKLLEEKIMHDTIKMLEKNFTGDAHKLLDAKL